MRLASGKLPLADLARQAQERPPVFVNRLARMLDMWEPQSLNEDTAANSHVRLCLERAEEYTGRLARFFAASLLLYNGQEELWKVVSGYVSELEILRAYRWRLCRILCTGNDEGSDKVVQLLCGWSDSPPPLSLPLPSIAADEECSKNIDLAITLAAQYSKTASDEFIIWTHTNPLPSIEGGSLGLALFLALYAAAKDLKWPNCWATGRLNEHGAVLDVGHIERKKKLCGREHLLVPDANEQGEMQETFSVRHVRDALEYCKNSESDSAFSHINLVVRARGTPDNIIPHLPHLSFPALEFIRKEYQDDQSPWWSPSAQIKLLSLFVQWPQIIGFDKRYDKELTSLLCALYPRTRLEDIRQSNPPLAWHLAMRHMRCLNHAGDSAGVIEIWTWASRLYNNLGSERYEELITAYSLAFGAYHNRYNFEFDPMDELLHKSSEKIKDFWGNVQDDGVSYKGLVNFFGFLGQHAAFRRQPEFALDYLDKSERASSNSDDVRQTNCYRFFVHQDACPCGEQAQACLCKVVGCGGLEGISRSLPQVDSAYALHAVARFLADSRMDGMTLDWGEMALEQLIKKYHLGRASAHPWQLVAYNIGCSLFYLENNAGSRETLLESLDMCWQKHAPPIIQTMGLLPLQKLWRAGYVPDDGATMWAQIQEIIRQHLHEPHFSPLIYSKTYEEAMEHLSNNLRKYFPFNYR